MEWWFLKQMTQYASDEIHMNPHEQYEHIHTKKNVDIKPSEKKTIVSEEATATKKTINANARLNHIKR